MYFLRDGDESTVVTSATDLTSASHCEFAFLRGIDVKLGRIDALDTAPDAMLERTSVLGDQHEARVLQGYRDHFGDGVVEIDRPDVRNRADLMDKASQTSAAFHERADVVFQATFWDDGADPGAPALPRIAFVGFADFIVHTSGGVYEVQDTKLARSARVTALLQLAAYGEQLVRIGVEPSDTVRLILGDGSTSEHRLRDITPVYRRRRARLRRIIVERLATTEAVAWGDPAYSACGHCDVCEAEIQAHRDVLLVAGLRGSQRALLRQAGVYSIEDLATAAPGSVPGMPDRTLATLSQQAALQLEPADGGVPAVQLYNPAALAALPLPDAGDIFFDFEGDPLYSEQTAGVLQWGLDYLFGLVEALSADSAETSPRFVPFWAHSFADEKRALVAFLDYVDDRRARFPGMHIYHYAPYERTHLLSLAARHGVGEDRVDDLLRQNVLVDLYPLVRKSLRVGSRSYSLKKLEPLYMGAHLRESDVTNAGDSITAYAEARVLQTDGSAADAARGTHILDEIGDYNRYDCESTLRLRDWLLELAAGQGVYPGLWAPDTSAELPEFDASPLHDTLIGRAEAAEAILDGVDSLSDAAAAAVLRELTAEDAYAFRLSAAAIDYHRREAKSFWWAHFSRLIQPLDEWSDGKDVFAVTGAQVDRDWHREGRQRTDRRHLLLRGALAPGSLLREGDTRYALYDYPPPFLDPRSEPGARGVSSVTVLEVHPDGSVLVSENQPKLADEQYLDFPVALVPGPPPSPGTQVDAIAEWGQRVADGTAWLAENELSLAAAPGEWPADPVLDILRRVPPRLGAGSALAPIVDGNSVAAVTASLLGLDSSYLAVQGPPGTGKTYLASHVIVDLVKRHHWKIGVVAQSHAVVENVLDRVVAAGLPAEQVGKVLAAGADAADHEFTALGAKDRPGFAERNALGGFVIGGTAWTFSNDSHVARGSLDLLVIDEAGQFSLAYTIASSVAARNLLLLGDPQQLPQVSQGTHPEPIDQSALGWISAGHDVLPPELGYFLAATRRMHPAVTEPVSALSYEGQLHADPSTSLRSLDGVEPGLHVIEVPHSGNATSSPEEAARVVELVSGLSGASWRDRDEAARPVEDGDIIVVTPYNAQVAEIRAALDSADLTVVRVGTVDKFQGQEAVIAIVSLAASSPEDVPRGMSFLLMKNRMNVGISRAQWAAYLLYSPALVDYLPGTPDGVTELSDFLRLVDSAG